MEHEPTEAVRATLLEAHRTIHSAPELSFAEHRTSRYLAERLGRMGIPHRSGLAGTGIVATLDTGRPGPVTAFRADMDALPIAEETELPYRSLNEGVMHACGHDMHSAILLGLAQHLASRVDDLVGVVKFLFQPGEEANGGAQRMIDDGALDAPAVERIFALHVVPQLPTGYVAIREGHMTATDDEFRIRVSGRGAHSSEPESGVNALTVAAHIVVALQGLAPSSLSPFSVSALTVSTLHSGEAVNVIPAEAVLGGMIRCLDADDKRTLRERILETADGIARGFGGGAEVEFVTGFPAVVNAAEPTRVVERAAKTALASPEHLIALERPHLGSEDFSYYQRVVPGAMLMLGCGDPGGEGGGLHTSTFAPDEDALPVGLRMLTAIAYAVNGGTR